MRIPPRYVVRRVLYLVAVVWMAATINFILPRIAARDPVLEYITEVSALQGQTAEGLAEFVEAYRTWAGVNAPLWEQYLIYMRNMIRMDFGYSLRVYRPVLEIIWQSMPWTLAILGCTTVMAFVLGTGLGALVGWPGSPRFLNAVVPFLMVIASIPPFIVALILLYVLAFRFNLFPLRGPYSATIMVDWLDVDFWLDVLHHAALPSLSLLLVTTGAWALGMRGMMITIVGEDFITFAEAKGVRRGTLFLRYAVRNLLLPQLTMLGLSLGALVSGLTLVEVMFSYPGIGHTLEEAIRAFDYNLIQGIVFFLIVTIAGATFILDMIYPLLDPRIAYR